MNAPYIALMLTSMTLTSADDFRSDVAPIFEAKCIRCHNDRAKKGGLDLTSAGSAFGKGRKGPVIVPGKPSESYLVESISGEKPDMPLNEPPLSAAQVATIRDWIAAGAIWPEGLILRDPSAPPESWWQRSDVRIGIAAAFAVMFIAAFVLNRMRSRGKRS